MRKSMLGRVGRRIGALLLSVCLFVCTEGMDAWATGAEVGTEFEVITEAEATDVMGEADANSVSMETESEEVSSVVEAETEVMLQENTTTDDNIEVGEEAEITEESAEQPPVLNEEYKYYKPYADATYELVYVDNEDGVEIMWADGTISGKLVIPETIE